MSDQCVHALFKSSPLHNDEADKLDDFFGDRQNQGMFARPQIS